MIKLDTNGTRPDIVSDLIRRGRIEAISMDIKTALDEQLSRATGVECDLDAIRQSIQVVMSSGIEYEFRTTVCPAFIGLDELLAIGQAIRGTRKYVLQQFRPIDCLDPAMREVAPYSREKLPRVCRRGQRGGAAMYCAGRPGRPLSAQVL